MEHLLSEGPVLQHHPLLKDALIVQDGILHLSNTTTTTPSHCQQPAHWQGSQHMKKSLHCCNVLKDTPVPPGWTMPESINLALDNPTRPWPCKALFIGALAHVTVVLH
jgi:hypothetical protein